MDYYVINILITLVKIINTTLDLSACMVRRAERIGYCLAGQTNAALLLSLLFISHIELSTLRSAADNSSLLSDSRLQRLCIFVDGWFKV